MRIRRELEISLESQCSSLAAEPPFYSVLGQSYRELADS